MDKAAIINRLLVVEAWAAGLQDECYKTRLLIQQEEGVSTPAKDQPALSERELAEVSARRKRRLFKNGN
jgi:hypothetical protein